LDLSLFHSSFVSTPCSAILLINSDDRSLTQHVSFEVQY
jgi:hypothetical protein